MDPKYLWKHICSMGAVMNIRQKKEQKHSCPSHDIELEKID